MTPENEKITGATIARTVVLVIAVVNQILTMCGKPVLPFDDVTITEVVSGLFLIVTSAIAWWHNNSFTQAALHGDIVMNAEKRAIKAKKEAEKEQE